MKNSIQSRANLGINQRHGLKQWAVNCRYVSSTTNLQPLIILLTLFVSGWKDKQTVAIQWWCLITFNCSRVTFSISIPTLSSCPSDLSPLPLVKEILIFLAIQCVQLTFHVRVSIIQVVNIVWLGVEGGQMSSNMQLPPPKMFFGTNLVEHD